MVDTKSVLEQMRAANPAPSLEQLAVDDLALVRDIVARERSGTTAPSERRPPMRPVQPTRRRRGIRPVLAAGLAFILVLGALGVTVLLFRASTGGEPAAPATTAAPIEEPTATADFTCPPGSTPDQAGPLDLARGGGSAAAFDPTSGLVLMLDRAFDVCTKTWTATNTWTALLEPGEVFDDDWDFVYDVDSARAISFSLLDETGDESVIKLKVWVYEPASQTWTRENDWPIGPHPEPSKEQRYNYFFPEPQAVYDPVSGLVVVREPYLSAMWTYDVDTDIWTEIDQGAILPPALDQRGPHVELLTYDASVDRLILYVASDGAERSVRGTWEFDLRAGRWEKQQTDTPEDPRLGWWPSGEEFTYDEANQVSVLIGGAYVAIYNATEHRWTVLEDSDPPNGRVTTYDPINQRILLAGGATVYAFNVGTEEWTNLLEPEPAPGEWSVWPVVGVVLALALYLLLAAYGKPLWELLRRSDHESNRQAIP